MKLAVSFLTNGCQNPLKWMMTAKFRAFSEKLLATEVAADALGEEWKSYVVRISGGNDKQGFPMKQGVLTHCRVCLHWARDILVIDQGELERGSASVFEDILWMPIWVISAWLLLRKERRVFLDWQRHLCPGSWDSEEFTGNERSSQYVVRKLTKVRSPGPKLPRLNVFLLYMSCNANANMLLWRDSTQSKMRRRLLNMLNLWPREWREPKKNAPDRVSGDIGCPHCELLLLSPVKMSNK